MIHSIRYTTILVLVCILTIGAASCKSKKKAMEASNAAKEKEHVEQEAKLRKQQEEEDARKREAEERARKEDEARREAEAKWSAPRAKLTQYFDAISTSGSVTSANTNINEALSMFASPETPVLIVISDYQGNKDYDKPTTIREYLHYLKDQRKNINTITDLKVDGSGKITEVELRKPL